MEVADGFFPNPYVHVNGLSHTASYLQQVEMTLLLTTPTTITGKVKVPIQHYSGFFLSTIKNPPEAYPRYATSTGMKTWKDANKRVSDNRRLDDMFSMPFNPHIINYEPLRGYMVPKFRTYDGTSDPFDYIMHYRQLMTLDIGNDALLCKVFLANLHGQALLWFHRLPKNSMNNFRDLSEAFVGHYLCSTHHKHNIKFMKRFGHAVLQVESCSMDIILQIFKRSIYLANKYSMLEDDVRVATQQVLVTNRPIRNDHARSSKPLNQLRQVNKGRDSQQ
ncbi:hypothetical protein AAG906_013022 [Vitis piasezkii]